jgi:hypothetical protein
MKRNLLLGIVFISAIVLSSCSAPNKLAGVKKSVINDDDVYYTQAKAGDKVDYIADAQNQQNSSYNGDDDYYYYGDYASRLNRFSNYSPFDYSDDFYYSYVPYNNGFGAGTGYGVDYYGYGTGYAANLATPFNDGYVYSPYDYGYSPYYMGGYDDFGYGDIYSAYILGGGASWRKHTHNTVSNIGVNPAVRGVRTTPSPGVTRITSRAAYYPGNPAININRFNGATRNGVNVNGVNNNSATRQARESFRQPQQQPVTPPPSYNSGSSNSSGGGASSGGGGRPVRP